MIFKSALLDLLHVQVVFDKFALESNEGVYNPFLLTYNQSFLAY